MLSRFFFMSEIDCDAFWGGGLIVYLGCEGRDVSSLYSDHLSRSLYDQK